MFQQPVCVQESTGLPLRTAPEAAILHPYWNNGHPKLSRFFNWAFGDGILLYQYPQYTYYAAPNATELLLLMLCAAVAPPAVFACNALSRGGALSILGTEVMDERLMHEDVIPSGPNNSWASLQDNPLILLMEKSPLLPQQFAHTFRMFLALFCAALLTQMVDFLLIYTDLLFRAFKSLACSRPPDRVGERNSLPRDEILVRAGLHGCCDACMLCAVAVQTKAVLLASEGGRIFGHWRRGRLWGNVGKRFMWWGLRERSVVQGERRNAWRKCVVLCGVWLVTLLSLLTVLRPRLCMASEHV